MFKKILYPTDFSEVAVKALEYIKQLKEAGSQEVVVLNVINQRILDGLKRHAMLDDDILKWRQKAEEIGLDHVDRGIDEVSSDGGGSSFTGQQFQDRAREMKVLDRWRHFIDDPEYVAAFDEETVELSRRIFGDVTARDDADEERIY